MASPVMRCPNCFAELSEGAGSSTCVKCNAAFGAGSSWSPISGQAVKSASLSNELSILKKIVGGAWIAIAALLFALAAKIGSNGGELAVVPGLLCLLVGGGIATAQTKRGVVMGLVATAVLLFIGFGLLKLIGAAIYSR